MWRDRCNGLKNFGAPSADKSGESDNFSSAHSKRNWSLAVVGTNQPGNAQSHRGIVAYRAWLIRFDAAPHHEPLNGIAVICSAFQDARALAITQNHHAVCYPKHFVKVMRNKDHRLTVSAQITHDFKQSIRLAGAQA
jgi:hypothetical protein